jgi:hypothetical protein
LMRSEERGRRDWIRTISRGIEGVHGGTEIKALPLVSSPEPPEIPEFGPEFGPKVGVGADMWGSRGEPRETPARTGGEVSETVHFRTP